MKLFEHPDFEQAILRAAEHFREQGLRPAIIEKDYYVTEALRVIAATAGDKVIFKGGTSLSKGWNLIQRFSEDIDIFLDPLAFQPALGKTGHRPRTQEAPRRRRGAPGPDVCCRAKARPSADSGAATASPTRNASAGPAKSPTACCLKPAPPAAANPPPSSSCGPISASSCRKPALSGRRGREAVSDAPAALPANLRREDVRHSQQGGVAQTRRTGRSAPTPGTTTTCFNWRRSQK